MVGGAQLRPHPSRRGASSDQEQLPSHSARCTHSPVWSAQRLGRQQGLCTNRGLRGYTSEHPRSEERWWDGGHLTLPAKHVAGGCAGGLGVAAVLQMAEHQLLQQLARLRGGRCQIARSHTASVEAHSQ